MTPRHTSACLIACVLALGLRAGWIGYHWLHFGAALEFPDEQIHWQLATNLVLRGDLVTDDGRFVARMPAYPLFLTLFAWLGPPGVLAARLAQAVLGAAAALAAATLAGRVWGERAAWCAGLLVACDPFGVFFANLLLSETLFTALLLWATLELSTWLALDRRAGSPDAAQPTGSRPPPWRLGGLLALALMTRPSAAGWVVLVWLLVALWTRPRSAAAAHLGVLAAATLLLLLPWGLRNVLVVGQPAWLSANGGVTLYDAQGPGARGDSDQSFLDELRPRPDLRGLDEVEFDAELQQRAWQQMRSDPARVLRLAWTKFVRTWNPWPNVAEYRGGWSGRVGAGFSILVYLGAAAGLACTLLRGRSAQRKLMLALWTPVIYFALLHCVYVGSVRYRVPLMPLLAVSAGAAVAIRWSRSSTPGPA